MIGKAFVWKAVTESALTAEFQRRITSGKKEYALVRAKMSELIGMVGASASVS